MGDPPHPPPNQGAVRTKGASRPRPPQAGGKSPLRRPSPIFSDIQKAILYSSSRAPVPSKDTAAQDGTKFSESEPRKHA